MATTMVDVRVDEVLHGEFLPARGFSRFMIMHQNEHIVAGTRTRGLSTTFKPKLFSDENLTKIAEEKYFQVIRELALLSSVQFVWIQPGFLLIETTEDRALFKDEVIRRLCGVERDVWQKMATLSPTNK